MSWYQRNAEERVLPDIWEILDRHGLKPKRVGTRVRAHCPWCVEGGVSMKKQGTLVASGTIEGGPFKCFRCDAKGNSLTIAAHYGDEEARPRDYIAKTRIRPIKPRPAPRASTAAPDSSAAPETAQAPVDDRDQVVDFSKLGNIDVEPDYADEWEQAGQTVEELLAGFTPEQFRAEKIAEAQRAFQEDWLARRQNAASRSRYHGNKESAATRAWNQIIASTDDGDAQRITEWAIRARGWPESIAASISVMDDIAAPEGPATVRGVQARAVVTAAQRIDRPLLIAVRDDRGLVRQISRRWIAPGSPTDGKPKAMALAADFAGSSESWGGVMVYGSIPQAVHAASMGEPIYLVEGAPDYLAMSGVADVANLPGVVLGLYSIQTGKRVAQALVKALGEANIIAPQIVIIPNIDQPRSVRGMPAPEHGIGVAESLKIADVLKGRAGVFIATIPLRDGAKQTDIADCIKNHGIESALSVLRMAFCHYKMPVHVDAASEQIKKRFLDAVTDATNYHSQDGKKRRLVILQIDPGAGKSWAALAASAAIATGSTSIPVNGRKPRGADDEDAPVWPPVERSVIFACQTHALAVEKTHEMEALVPGTPSQHIHGLLHHCEFSPHVGEIFPAVGRAGICGRAGTGDRCERAEYCPGALEPSAPRGMVTFCAHALLPSLKGDLVIIDEAAAIEEIQSDGAVTGITQDAVASLFKSTSLPRTKAWLKNVNPESADAARLLTDKIGPLANQHAADVSAGKAPNFSRYIDGQELANLIAEDDNLRAALIMGFAAKRKSIPPAPAPAEARKGTHGHRYMPSRVAFSSMVDLAEWTINTADLADEYKRACAHVEAAFESIQEDRRRKRAGKKSLKRTVADELKEIRAKAEKKGKKRKEIDHNQVALPIIGQDLPAEPEDRFLEGDADGAFCFSVPAKRSRAIKAQNRIKPQASIRLDPNGKWALEIRKVRKLPDAPVVMLDATGGLVIEEYQRAYPDRDVVVRSLSVQGSAPAMALHYDSRSFTRGSLIEDHGLTLKAGTVERVRRVVVEFCAAVEGQVEIARKAGAEMDEQTSGGEGVGEGDGAGESDGAGEGAATPKQNARIAILTHKPIADAMIHGMSDQCRLRGESVERLFAIAETVRKRGFDLEVGWFGNHDRGINSWQTVDGLLVIGDPTSNLGATRQYAKLIGMDPDAITKNRTEATCQQAIARSRSIRRKAGNRVVLAFAGQHAPAAPGVVWESVELTPGPLPAAMAEGGSSRAADLAGLVKHVADTMGMVGVAVVANFNRMMTPWHSVDVDSTSAARAALARAVSREASVRGWEPFKARTKDGRGRPAVIYSHSERLVAFWADNARSAAGRC